MLTTRQYLEIVATGLSETTGVKLETGRGWAYNPASKTLMYNPDNLTALPHDIIKGLLLHEIGHSLYTGVIPETALMQQHPQLKELYNRLEDIRIERKLRDQFGNFAGGSLSRLEAHTDDLNLSLTAQEVESWLKFTHLGQVLHYSVTHSPGSSLVQHFIDIMPDPIREQFSSYQQAGQFYRLRQLANGITATASSSDELIHRIDTELAPLLVDWFEDDKAKSQPQPTPSEEPGQASQQLTKEEYKRMLKGNTKRGRQAPQVLPYEEAKALMQPYIKTLAKYLHDVLEENAQPRIYGRFKHGLLTSGRIADVCLGDTRPFKRRDDGSQPRYSFKIALDASGSMSQAEIDGTAYLSALTIMEAARAIECPVSVYQFGWDGVKLADQDHPQTLQNYVANQGSTCDSEALKLIAQDTSEADNTIVFIVGDGMGDDPEALAPHFTALKRKGAVVMGVGIQFQATHYPNSIKVDKPHELTRTLIGKIKNLIKRKEN